MKRPSLVALLLGAATCFGSASAQSLVKDINAVAVNPGSDPGSVTSVILGTTVFFSALDPVNGTELWRTDGTPAGTFLLKDINPGTASSSPAGFFSFTGLVLFRATDGVNGSELWISDGTAVGTKMLKDINTGSGSSSPSNFVFAGSYAFFSAADATGTELWRTDFTTAGTVQVKDINSTTATASSLPNRFASFNGKAYFAANDGVSGTELWTSDGTAAGTVQVLDINTNTPTASGFPTSITVAAGKLFFFADNGSTGSELWVSDGTISGTVLVKDINPGSASSASVQEITRDFNGALYFTATEASTGHELWKSDGTLAGTTLVMDFNPGPGSGADSIPTACTQFGSFLLIAADDGVNGKELWKTDGTTLGTTLVKDIAPGAADSGSPQEMMVSGGIAYMSAYHPSYGVELWKSDGTAAGTQLVKDIYFGGAQFNGIPRFLAPIASKVVFQAIDTSGVGGTNRELWISDGTTAGTVMLKEINPPSPTATGYANPGSLTEYKGKLYFAANDGINGTELWVSDGTAAGTQMVIDIYAGPDTGLNGPIRVMNNLLIFTATTLANGQELWKSDGTAAGTAMIKDINPGSGNGAQGSSQTFAVFGNKLIFAGNDGVNGQELWVSDGTAAGTFMLGDIAPGSQSSSPLNVTVCGPYVYCSGYDSSAGNNELIRTDGSVAGTIFMDLNPGSASSFPSGFTFYGGRTFFAATSVLEGSELWVTDGSLAGTSLVLDIRSGTQGSSPSQFFAYSGKLFFSANDGINGTELWRSDGTAAGTALFLNISAGTGSSSPTAYVNANGTMFFRAGDTVNGTELWKSDGTVAGTVLVKDIQVGTGSGFFGSQTYQAGSGTLVLIPGNDGTTGSGTGSELWRSDGTAAGTTRVADIFPGTGSSSPASFTRVGTTVFFTANDGVKGVELYSIPLSVVGANLVENIGQGCPGTGNLVPKAGTNGMPWLGNAAFAVKVTDGRPLAACVLLLSASSANVSLGNGCFLYVGLPTIDLPSATDILGSSSMTLPIPPNSSMLGGELWWQWGVIDPNGAFKNVASISDGLHTMFGF